jgi:hypothetical protein
MLRGSCVLVKRSRWNSAGSVARRDAMRRWLTEDHRLIQLNPSPLNRALKRLRFGAG